MLTLAVMVAVLLGVMQAAYAVCEKRRLDPIPVSIVIGALWFLALAAGLPYIV